jgi:hypothetical protein
MMNLDRDQFLDQCFVVLIVVVFAVPLSFALQLGVAALS